MDEKPIKVQQPDEPNHDKVSNVIEWYLPQRHKCAKYTPAALRGKLLEFKKTKTKTFAQVIGNGFWAQ
jgi:hypothetical protein